MKKIAILTLLFLVISSLAQAHVKWFTGQEPVKESIEQILSPLFLTLALLTAIILGILPQIVPKLTTWKMSKQLDKKLESFRSYVYPLLCIGTAIALVLQLGSGTLFAPEIELSRTGLYWE
jgi:hypothetical protein